MSNTNTDNHHKNNHLSYDVLFKDHSNLIFKLIYNFIRSKNMRISWTEVDDIYQDVALKIFKNDYLSRYNEEKSSFVTWLSIICRTTAIDYYRKNVRWAEDMLTEATLPQTDGNMDALNLSLPANVLTERQAEIITLLFRDEMVAGEIAATLGITARTVRSIKFQALERLRTHYETATTQLPGQEAGEMRRRAS